MKVIIAGSRDIIDFDLVEQAVRESGFEITEIVSGGAKGVDSLGEDYANLHDIPTTVFPAQWKKHGPAAGPIRNRKMAEYVGKEGCLVLVWDGKSRGSSDMLITAKELGLNIYQKVINGLHKKQ